MSPKVLIADVLKYGATVVVLLTLLLNFAPGLHVPASWQAVIATIVAFATGVMSVLKQLEGQPSQPTPAANVTEGADPSLPPMPS